MPPDLVQNDTLTATPRRESRPATADVLFTAVHVLHETIIHIRERRSPGFGGSLPWQQCPQHGDRGGGKCSFPRTHWLASFAPQGLAQVSYKPIALCPAKGCQHFLGSTTDPSYLPITLRACCSCGAARRLTVLVGSAVGMITPGDEAVLVNATARGTLSPRESHPQPRLLPWEHVGLTPTAHQSGKIFSQTFLVNHADQSK